MIDWNQSSLNEIFTSFFNPPTLKLTSQDRLVHTQFSTYGRNAKEWLRKCALLLPEIDRRRIWKKRGCGSIYEYAAKVAGMSRHSVEETLRVLRRIEDKPSLLELVKEKGIQRVRPLASIATVETQDYWADMGRAMSKNALETYVKNYRSESLPREGSQPAKKTIQLTLDSTRASKLEQLGKRADFPELLDRLIAFAEAKDQKEKPQAVVTSSRHVPAKIDKFVEARTSGLCAYPGCSKIATSIHHTQRWALENVHDPDRLHLLCTDHERIAHRGLIENEEQSPEKWRLREYADPLERKAYIDSLVNLHRQK